MCQLIFEKKQPSTYTLTDAKAKKLFYLWAQLHDCYSS